jgi:hypothetical protein
MGIFIAVIVVAILCGWLNSLLSKREREEKDLDGWDRERRDRANDRMRW